MVSKQFSRFLIDDVPEYQRLKVANPQNPDLNSLQAIIMYGRAIHWASIFDVIWPDFDKIDRYFTIELAYIVINDPDESILPLSFYEYLRNMIVMFWEMQLQTLYPQGDWTIVIDDDPEMTIELEIKSRS